MKWRVFLVFTILAIIAGVWLIFSMVVPAPYGRLEVTTPQSFSVLLDGKAFNSGKVVAGKHTVEAQYQGITLLKEDIYVKPDENSKLSLNPVGLLLKGPASSMFSVETDSGVYNGKGSFLWLPNFSGKATVMINGNAVPLNVKKDSFVGLSYSSGVIKPIEGSYYLSVPIQSEVGTETGTYTLPAVLPEGTEFKENYSQDGNILVLTASLTTGTLFRTSTGNYVDVKIASDTSLIAFTATSASQYNIQFGWRIWTIDAPESSGSWFKAKSGFVFYGKKVWAYKDNGAWLWVHEPVGKLVDVKGNYLVFQTDKGMVFWDIMEGERTDSPKFDFPSNEFIQGTNFLYSGDGKWFSGFPALAYSWNDKWLAVVSNNHDIILFTR